MPSGSIHSGTGFSRALPASNFLCSVGDVNLRGFHDRSGLHRRSCTSFQTRLESISCDAEATERPAFSLPTAAGKHKDIDIMTCDECVKCRRPAQPNDERALGTTANSEPKHRPQLSGTRAVQMTSFWTTKT